MVAAGTKGIGLEVAKTLADEGVRISLCARDQRNFHAVLSLLGPDHQAYPCDVANPADLDAWFSLTLREMGPPDILITNSGGPPAGIWPDMTDEQWQLGFENSFMHAVRLVRLAAPHMRAKGWGRIVHITSLTAKEPAALLPISSAMRSGLSALTRLQAAELAASGITVNAVLPGHTLTERQVHLAQIRAEKQGISVEEALRETSESLPIKRLADPREIAAPIAFLCSKPAAYVSGVSLLVDGGAVKGIG